MMKRWLLLFLLLPVFAHVHAQSLPDFADLAERQGAAVVNISTTQTLKGRSFGHGFPFDENDEMFEFFRRFAPHAFPRGPQMQPEFESKSLGSGFIISEDGYILTNAHVVADADEVVVKLKDKREIKARVVGADRRTDVALIKIEAQGLQTVRLGDSEQLRVGEWVVAIGSPFGFENTVTAGIVSAKGRSLPQENYVPFIQTDVAINPGNSGGPLFNMKGEVVGVNSQIYSRSGGYQGIAFSIPIDVAMDVQAQLRSSGKVSRGRLGVLIQEIDKDLASSFGLDKAEGALIAEIQDDSPAQQAGLQVGDVILAFNGEKLRESSDLPRLVGGNKPGSTATLKIWRGGEAKNIVLTLGEMPDEMDAAVGPGGKSGKKSNRLGLLLSEPNAMQKRQLGISHGLIVEKALDRARGQLRQGDILLALISKGVQAQLQSVRQFNQLLSQQDASASITLLVKRGDGQIFVTIKGEEN